MTDLEEAKRHIRALLRALKRYAPPMMPVEYHPACEFVNRISAGELWSLAEEMFDDETCGKTTGEFNDLRPDLRQQWYEKARSCLDGEGQTVEGGDPRFFIDHGMIHDRETGQHVTTAPDDEPWNGMTITGCLEFLNALSAELTRLRAEQCDRRTVLEEAAAYNDKLAAMDHAECGHGPGYSDGRSDASACIRALKDQTPEEGNSDVAS